MESGELDLNEPPYTNQEDGLEYVFLQKESKIICRARVRGLAIKVPFDWSIVNFVPAKEYQPTPKVLLLPAPENSYQNNEWTIFMRFLWTNKRAAIVPFGSATFQILAPQPDGGVKFSHAVVMCERDHNGSGGCKQMARTSVRQLNSPAVNVSKRTTIPTKNFFVSNPSFLRTLGDAHDVWIFGALAELIDNSRDADASRLDISVQSMFLHTENTRVPGLSIIDDGHGMTYADMMRMISFGHKGPDEHCHDKIGRYGVGFKTGAMKLGKDVVVLTQTPCSRSVAFLSQSFNEGKGNVEIPVVAYKKKGPYMEFDLSIQSEATANYHLGAIKKFSPFNEYFLGEKLGIFGEDGTGTQIYIWNLDKWGADYTLEWHPEEACKKSVHTGRGDILIRSRRVRQRPGQTSSMVPLDYSLQSYLEVMFLNPRMKIYVQGSLVKSRPLAKTLNKTSVMSGEIMGRTIMLTLGMSEVERERNNCGIFLYWHGRLIEPYKRVGGQKHNADMGRGLIGVADITDLIDDEDGHSWVLNNKQGFKDCEIYAKLEEWLGRKVDEYWDARYDSLQLRKGGERYKADDEWVQCYSCRKWRVLSPGFSTETLPDEWFCHMPPFNGKCEIPEQQMGRGVIVVGEKRSGYDEHNRVAAQKEKPAKKSIKSENIEVQMSTQDKKDLKNVPMIVNKGKKPSNDTASMPVCISDDDDLEGVSSQTAENSPPRTLKRLKRGPPKSCKK